MVTIHKPHPQFSKLKAFPITLHLDLPLQHLVQIVLFPEILIQLSNRSIKCKYHLYTFENWIYRRTVELTIWQERFFHLPLFSSFISEETLKFHEIMELLKPLDMKGWKNVLFQLSRTLIFLFLEIFLERIRLDEVYENWNLNALFININF